MKASDVVALAALGGGLILLSKSMSRGKRKPADLTGEECDPEDAAPYGYECRKKVDGTWALIEDPRKYSGDGAYLNEDGVGDALERLGFDRHDLMGFQYYMSSISDKWSLAVDGSVDRATILALEEAESMLKSGDWIPPEEA